MKRNISLYAYVNANPLSFADPLGLIEWQGADGKYDAFVCISSCVQETYGQSLSSIMTGGAITAALGTTSQSLAIDLAKMGGRSAARQFASRALFSGGAAAIAFGTFNVCYGLGAIGYCGYTCDAYYNPNNR
jgi:hypothetical protein